MRSINDNEINRLKIWAAEESNGSFDRAESDALDSFWKNRESDSTYIKEYAFTNVPEFEALCTDILGHELNGQIKKVISVAVMKNAPRPKREKEDKQEDEKLPEYIYVF